MKDELETLKTFDCKRCEEKFESESDLKIHGNFAHPVFKFAFEVCKKSPQTASFILMRGRLQNRRGF